MGDGKLARSRKHRGARVAAIFSIVAMAGQQWLHDWYNNQRDTRKHRYLSVRVLRKSARTRVLEFILRRKLALPGDYVGEMLRPVLQHGHRVFEIGCGYGKCLAMFKRFGIDVAAIETSQHRVEYAVRKGFDVRNMPIEAVDETTFAEPFDVVCSNHVLEHVRNPVAFLQAACKILLKSNVKK